MQKAEFGTPVMFVNAPGTLNPRPGVCETSGPRRDAGLLGRQGPEAGRTPFPFFLPPLFAPSFPALCVRGWSGVPREANRATGRPLLSFSHSHPQPPKVTAGGDRFGAPETEQGVWVWVSRGCFRVPSRRPGTREARLWLRPVRPGRGFARVEWRPWRAPPR